MRRFGSGLDIIRLSSTQIEIWQKTTLDTIQLFNTSSPCRKHILNFWYKSTQIILNYYYCTELFVQLYGCDWECEEISATNLGDQLEPVTYQRVRVMSSSKKFELHSSVGVLWKPFSHSSANLQEREGEIHEFSWFSDVFFFFFSICPTS